MAAVRYPRNCLHSRHIPPKLDDVCRWFDNTTPNRVELVQQRIKTPCRHFLMCISQHFKHVNIVPYSKRQLKDKIINYNLVFSLICFDVGFFVRKPSDVISRIFCGCTGLHFNRSL